jgi:hypothetical protein
MLAVMRVAGKHCQGLARRVVLAGPAVDCLAGPNLRLITALVLTISASGRRSGSIGTWVGPGA